MNQTPEKQSDLVRRFRPSRWIAACLCAWLVSSEVALQADDPADYTSTLIERGLVKKGSFWLVREEVDWEGELARLDADEKACDASRRKVEGLLRQRSLAAQSLRQVQAEYDQLRGLLDAGKLAPQQRSLVSAEADKRSAILAGLRSTLGNESDGDPPPLKAGLVAWADARTRLIVDILQLERRAMELSSAYQRLAKEPDVTLAISLLGPPNRLGPARNLSRDMSRIEKLKSQVFTSELPIYRENGVIRLSTVIQERVPATFNYDPKIEETWLPAWVAEAAGMQIPDSEPAVTLKLNNGRTLSGRRVKIDSIRLGNHVLADVDALVLSPEASHLGANLGRKALRGLKVHADMSRYQLIVAPAEEAGNTDRKKREPSGVQPAATERRDS